MAGKRIPAGKILDVPAWSQRIFEQVVQYAIENGSGHAAKRFNISRGMVERWRRQLKVGRSPGTLLLSNPEAQGARKAYLEELKHQMTFEATDAVRAGLANEDNYHRATIGLRFLEGVGFVDGQGYQQTYSPILINEPDKVALFVAQTKRLPTATERTQLLEESPADDEVEI